LTNVLRCNNQDEGHRGPVAMPCDDPAPVVGRLEREQR
jgi:hypothetical protein